MRRRLVCCLLWSCGLTGFKEESLGALRLRLSREWKDESSASFERSKWAALGGVTTAPAAGSLRADLGTQLVMGLVACAVVDEGQLALASMASGACVGIFDFCSTNVFFKNDEVLAETDAWLRLAGPLVCIAPVFLEELIFRGPLLLVSHNDFEVFVAAIASALAFGAVHAYDSAKDLRSQTATTTRLLSATKSGLLYASVLVLTRSLQGPAVAHLTYNLLWTYSPRTHADKTPSSG